MAKGFDMLHIKSAVKSRNKFDLSRSHLTTMDFGQIVPLMVEETVPGDQFNIGAQYFSRMAPLAVPTYGKFSFKTVSAFVPYHQIADDADAWLAGMSIWEGSSTVHRYFTIGTLDTFLRNNNVLTTSVGATATNSDYTVLTSSGTASYRVFTNVGRYWVKILNSLGYALPEGVDLQTGSDWLTNISSIKLSAYPLLAFFKAYNDWMSTSQMFNTSQLTSLLRNIKHNVAVSSSYYSTGELTHNGLRTLFQYLLLNYENDYFTSAWQQPNASIGSNVQMVNSAAVPADSYETAYAADDSVRLSTTYNNANISNLSVSISQRALDWLKSFDDWVRRNNYSGSRAVQKVYSKFGVKTDDYRSNYAHILGTDTMPVQIGDVTSTATTIVNSNEFPLGDYAGKGIMSGNKGLSFRADDYGLLMTIGYFTVQPMYSFGFDRAVLRNTPFDYYNPEFDGIGADAISYMEVYEDPTVDPSTDLSSDVDVFGYTERYNAYRFGRDKITGDWRRFDSDPMTAWHTGRNLTALRKNTQLSPQTSAFNTMDGYDSEYNRIFSVQDNSVDHFYLTCNFNISAVRPMLSLNQVPRLGEGDTDVPKNGNVIN